MKTHVHDMVKRIVAESPEFAIDEIEEIIEHTIKTLIRDMSKGIVKENPDFSVDEVEEMMALVMKCLLAGVDVEKVINETFTRLRFYR